MTDEQDHVREVGTDAAPPPQDGETKVDETGSRWTACCGVWYSEDAWLPPRQDVERDPALAARTHQVVPAGTVNCTGCGRSLRRAEPDAVDAAAVLAVVEERDAPNREAAYAERLRDTREGTWIRFGPVDVAPGSAARVPVVVVEPVADVAFLALPASVAATLRVLDVVVGHYSFLDGPVPGEVFAVRIPADASRPIDRGGSLNGRAAMHPSIPAYVVLENWTKGVVRVMGALFAPRRPVLSVVSGDPAA